MRETKKVAIQLRTMVKDFVYDKNKITTNMLNIFSFFLLIPTLFCLIIKTLFWNFISLFIVNNIVDEKNLVAVFTQTIFNRTKRKQISLFPFFSYTYTRTILFCLIQSHAGLQRHTRKKGKQ
jgi:hypothetical protein